MSNNRPFCVEARTEATKQVHKWLVSPTREDMQRYRGILDALASELEEDGSL